MSDVPYLLGASEAEWARLQRQHALWRDTLLADLDAAGVGPGSRVLEVGCGPGLLLADLATRFGADRVAGLERSAASVRAARARLPEIVVRQGDLATADLDGPWDAVVLRWVLSFVPEVGPAVARLASALAPGGVLVVQDYDHDGVDFTPPAPVLWRHILAMRRAYTALGGDLHVARRLPGDFAAAGLTVERVEDRRRSGPARGPLGRWFRDFVVLHGDTFVSHGDMDPADRDAAPAACEAWASQTDATFTSPGIRTVVGRAVS